MSARHEGPLQTRSLVERKPLTSTVTLGFVLRQVDRAKRLVLRHQIARSENRFRQRIGDGVEHVEHLAHAGVDIPALHLGGGRIDREEVALEPLEQQFANAISRGLGDLRQRFGALAGVQNQKRRMGQLHCAPVVPDLTRQHHADTFDQTLLQILRVEERRGHPRLAVSEGYDEEFALGSAVRPLRLGLRDGVHEGDVLAFLRRFVILPEHRRARVVLPRVMAHKVVDGADTEVLLELACRLGPENVFQPIGQRDHCYSTPINSASPR